MDFGNFAYVLIVAGALFFYFTSYSFQAFYRSRTFKKAFSDKFCEKVKGVYISQGYYSTGHRVISHKEYSKLPNRDRVNFGRCYNIVSFKTSDARWELFFHLVREHAVYKQFLSVRCFPNVNRIRSEANIEMNHGRLQIFANNRYLTGILEKNDSHDLLKSLLKTNGDVFLVSRHMMHCEIKINQSMIGVQRALNIVKYMNSLMKKIYKENVLEY